MKSKRLDQINDDFDYLWTEWPSKTPDKKFNKSVRGVFDFLTKQKAWIPEIDELVGDMKRLSKLARKAK